MRFGAPGGVCIGGGRLEHGARGTARKTRKLAAASGKGCLVHTVRDGGVSNVEHTEWRRGWPRRVAWVAWCKRCGMGASPTLSTRNGAGTGRGEWHGLPDAGEGRAERETRTFPKRGRGHAVELAPPRSEGVGIPGVDRVSLQTRSQP